MPKKWKMMVRAALDALLIDEPKRAQKILVRCLSDEKIGSLSAYTVSKKPVTFSMPHRSGGGHGSKR